MDDYSSIYDAISYTKFPDENEITLQNSSSFKFESKSSDTEVKGYDHIESFKLKWKYIISQLILL